MKRLPLLLCLLLAACATAPAGKQKLGSDFRLEYLAKSDVDRTAEIHQQAALEALRTLMTKLYRRNPQEWRKGGHASAEAAVARVFDRRHDWRFIELDNRRGTDAITLAFDESFAGDRVLAFIGGMGGMMMAAYNDKTEFYFYDDLDPQKLYNSARNVEIAAWKLGSARNARGELFLLSNEELPVRNLSFEREFGKLIANQDILARIVAEKTNRSIKQVVQGVATAVFLPIP